MDEVPWWEETGMDGDGGVKTTETAVLGEQPFRGRGGAGRAHARTCSVPQRVMSDSTTPWTVAHKAPLSMEFFRQEHWSGPLVKMTNRREARVEGE